MTRVAIIGGGPGGYEAALVARQLGGEVTLFERGAAGGSAVLTDCVPSKALIAASEMISALEFSREMGLTVDTGADDTVKSSINVDLGTLNGEITDLAQRQSDDIREKLADAGVELVHSEARLDGPNCVVCDDGDVRRDAEIILIATGTTPRRLPDAMPDGERILDWQQLYSLDALPERLIVVGSGVTGAEFASAYHVLGSEITLVSSRDMVLPGADTDAARVLQDVFERRGMTIMSHSRAKAARRTANGVVVTLEDGREVEGTHCLMAVGSIPNTAGIGLAEAGVELTPSGHVVVDGVSRTSVRGVYAAGDVTGVLALASVAAMQGRTAMRHALGDAVAPFDRRTVSSNVFTSPEVATVGFQQSDIDEGTINAVGVMLPLAGNARAKMQRLRDGFVKLFCLPVTGIIVGGVVVAPAASELIHSITLAVSERMTVDRFAQDFTVYPSLTGSLAEAARQLRKDHPPQYRI